MSNVVIVSVSYVTTSYSLSQWTNDKYSVLVGCPPFTTNFRFQGHFDFWRLCYLKIVPYVPYLSMYYAWTC